MQAVRRLASDPRSTAVLPARSSLRADPGMASPIRRESGVSAHARAAASWLSGFVVALALLGLSACSIKLVADYDATTFEEILRIAKKVDHFYGSLLETPEKDRKYAGYSEKYVEIETEIRSLSLRNRSRPLNQDSTAISESILNLWVKYKQAHRDRDAYPSGIARLDRNRFSRLFGSAADAEAAKKLDAEDRDAAKDSK